MVLRKIGKILLYAVAGAAVSILLLMLAATLALNRAPRYQAEMKDWVHEHIGYHIAFTHVSPALRWHGPELYFEQLELRSKDDRRVLARAAGGRIGADIWQLLRNGKLYAARIELEAPDVVIMRIGPNQFALASEVGLGGGAPSLSSLRLEDLPAGTLAIRHGLVTIRNWNAKLPELQLRGVELELERGDGDIELSVAAKLPAVLGGIVNADGAARGSGRLDMLDWTMHGRTQELSFAGLRELMPDILTRVASGTGGFEVAARGRGAALGHADLNFDVANLTMQLTDEPVVNFDRVAGAVGVTVAGDRWTLKGRRVRALRQGRRDPDSDVDLTWRGDAGLVELQAKASYLRAETLLPLAGLLPQKDLRERLQDLAPTGEWLDTRLNLTRAAATDPWSFDVQARFRDMGFAPTGRAPGLRGLSGTLSGNQNGGRVDVDAHAAKFAWPAELQQPVVLEHLQTTLYWKHTAENWLVATPSLDLTTHDASMHAKVAWQQPVDGSSPLLTLAAGVDNGNVANVRQYLPRTRIAPSAYTWVNRAFLAGRMPHADVVIQGPILHYPFRDGSGLFLARLKLEGLSLDYKQGWPIMENVAGLAEFRNEGLTMQLAGGRIDKLTLESGDARFADFKTGELQVHALLSGDAGDALGYLRDTPLDAAAEHVFSAVEAAGPMSADVDLFLPFKEFDRRHTLVTAHLHGVSLNRKGSPLMATELSGDADVDGSQVSRADVRGKLLGGPFLMTARTPRNRPVTRTTLVFNGLLTGEAVHSALSLPATIPIGGTTDWHGVLRMAPAPARERLLRINASLAGLDLNLPEPLAKPVGRALPTVVEVEWPDGERQQVRLTLGAVLRAQFSLDSDANGPTLSRAAVAFGTASGSSAAPLRYSESQQLAAGGTIDRLDLAGWLKLYSPDRNARPLGSLLRSAELDISQIDYLGLSFMDVAVELAVTDSGWRIGLGGPNVVGSISMPAAADAGEPWKMDFQRLKFVDGPPAAGSTPLPASETGVGGANPRGIPAVKFHAAELIWDDRQLGDVEATLSKLDDGISLQHLTVTAPSFSAAVKGEWRGEDAGTARVQGTLTSTDVGATLKDLGYDALIEAKSGSLDYDLSWLGAPNAASLSMATGHVQAALDRGQLTGIKPGAGRVLGLTNLAALPRRLSLDFSDLTDKGFAFDTVRGDFDLHDGSAYTDNLLVEGPAAEIGLIGRVGLKNKDYDQTVVVTGNVSGTLPLAAFVAGPVVGGAVLLFTQVFKQPLQGLARGYYRITGNWDSPIVERIKSADAAAATAEAVK